MALTLIPGCQEAAQQGQPASCDDPAPGIICSVVGTGDWGFNGDGLAPLDTMLFHPTSVRLSPEGELTFADFNNMRIRVVRDGAVQTVAGNGIHAYGIPGEVATSVYPDPGRSRLH